MVTFSIGNNDQHLHTTEHRARPIFVHHHHHHHHHYHHHHHKQHKHLQRAYYTVNSGAFPKILEQQELSYRKQIARQQHKQ